MNGLTSADMAEKWASFSGDRNPIHFDLAVAHRVGADRLVVHGMLALLHVKQEMTQRLTAPDGRPLVEFNAFFRLPALQGSKTELTVKSKGDTVLAFDFSAEGRCCIRGNACAKPRDGLRGRPSPDRRWIRQDHVGRKRQQFGSLFPFVSHPWIFLDALVFSDFLKEHFDHMAALTSNVVPFQMSHRVRFDAALLQQTFDQTGDYPAVSYVVERIGAAQGTAEQSGVAILAVQVAGQPLMEIEIGLIGKTLPSGQHSPFTNQ